MACIPPSPALRRAALHSWTNWQKPAKNNSKSLFNCLVILIPATVWQIFKLKCTKSTETEIKWICRILIWKNREITSKLMKLILAGLSSLKPLFAAVCLDRLEVCRLPQNHLWYVMLKPMLLLKCKCIFWCTLLHSCALCSVLNWKIFSNSNY